MIIGVPKEIKKGEYRVGMTPEGVEELRGDDHSILIEKSAGEGSDFSDDEYNKSGAEIVDREDLFSNSELIVKVLVSVTRPYKRTEPSHFLHP
jgi:alanine dehydrogenase